MVTINNNHSEYKYRNAEGKEILVAELECDTLSELVGLTSLGNVIFARGSRAHAIKDAELCSLASNGKWYKQSDGSEVV
jgi:hypothetical protein